MNDGRKRENQICLSDGNLVIILQLVGTIHYVYSVHVFMYFSILPILFCIKLFQVIC